MDAFYNTIVLRSPDDYEPLGPEWFPTEPQLVNGRPGRFVIHTGGRGLVRVTVTATETPAPSLSDSSLEEWDICGKLVHDRERDALLRRILW